LFEKCEKATQSPEMSSENSRSLATTQQQQQQSHSKRHISNHQAPTGSKHAESNMVMLMKSFDYELNLFLKENKSLTGFTAQFSSSTNKSVKEEERERSQSFNQVLDELVSKIVTNFIQFIRIFTLMSFSSCSMPFWFCEFIWSNWNV
jgi:hypothetical protein